MQSQTMTELRRRKSTESFQSRERAVPQKEPVHSQTVPPQDDIQARIDTRAYELYAKHGFRQSYALDDWLEAEGEILSLECNA
ncbi:MAG: DUF2934 domain-containing protein [Nitrospira sp.]|nr:DUF2934 domain-containing protein [Nitrospira sp.]MBH0183399.1 DUF2934 domain-containing protein [Nitrospira sp.]MBH0186856.1 DUF2934 domain-containing protein [Nitrospira sp.]